MKHLLIATPVYDQSVSVGYCQSLCMTLAACTKAKIVLSTDYKGGPYIEDNRNWLVHRFMRSNADAILFVDADVTWDEKAVVKLYESKYDMCGGAYPIKEEMSRYPIHLLDTVDGEYRECLYLPGGFVLIRRHVFEKLKPHVPSYTERAFGNEQVACYYQNVVAGGGRIGEDVEIGNRWRKIGGRIWCLPDIDFEHQGPRSWTGNLSDYLAATERTEKAA